MYTLQKKLDMFLKMKLTKLASVRYYHIGSWRISARDQNLRILAAPRVWTSWSKCVHRTLPNPSINRFTSSRRISSSPDRHCSRYFSSFSSPAWICLCWLNSSSSFRNSGIFFANTGKMCCSSMEWWKSNCEQNWRPIIIIWRAESPRFLEFSQASQSWFHVKRKWLCCMRVSAQGILMCPGAQVWW